MTILEQTIYQIWTDINRIDAAYRAAVDTGNLDAAGRHLRARDRLRMEFYTYTAMTEQEYASRSFQNYAKASGRAAGRLA